MLPPGWWQFWAAVWHCYGADERRVLEELNDSGTMQARYTTEDGSYYGQWLHLYRTSGTLSRFPMYDNIGTARGLVDASGAVTDTYELDTFGRSVSSSGTTPNPYRFGAAWGYITDPSGFLQLGARYYWPEIGRFVSQDPIGEGGNWYAYVGSNPVVRIDPSGGVFTVVWGLVALAGKTYATGQVVGNAVAAGIYAAACHDCHESTDRMICLAKDALDWEDYDAWLDAAKPYSECKEVCDQAASRGARAVLWLAVRVGAAAGCPRASSTWD